MGLAPQVQERKSGWHQRNERDVRDKVRELHAQGQLAESEGRLMEAANCLRLALELDDRQDLRGEYDLIVLKVREQMARSLRRSP